MNDPELRKLQVEAWKTTIQVQQHFNEIEMKIRALAITVITAGIGAAAVAIRDGTTLSIFGWKANLGATILLISFLAWMLFYFVDHTWYHRLLLGAVRHGEDLEKILSSDIPGFGLTTAISKKSPVTLGRPSDDTRQEPRGAGTQRTNEPADKQRKPGILDRLLTFRSSKKLRTFYLGVGFLLLLMAAFAQVGGLGTTAPSWIRVKTSSETFCGALVVAKNGRLTIDDEFRHSTRSVRFSDVQAESIVQSCT